MPLLFANPRKQVFLHGGPYDKLAIFVEGFCEMGIKSKTKLPIRYKGGVMTD